MSSTVEELTESIHANAVAKGFWDKTPNFAEQIMLVVTELAECVEAHRSGKMARPMDLKAYLLCTPEDGISTLEGRTHFEDHFKDTVQDELADAIIRILDICGGHDIDIAGHIDAKMFYNSTRPHMHGKKY